MNERVLLLHVHSRLQRRECGPAPPTMQCDLFMCNTNTHAHSVCVFDVDDTSVAQRSSDSEALDVVIIIPCCPCLLLGGDGWTGSWQTSQATSSSHSVGDEEDIRLQWPQYKWINTQQDIMKKSSTRTHHWYLHKSSSKGIHLQIHYERK